jgi:hypothetical protein
MPPVLAAKLIRDGGVDIGRIRAITISLWRPYTEYPGTNYQGPYERTVQTLASTAFAVSAMLVRRELEYDVALHGRDDPAILQLVKLTTVVPHDGLFSDSTVTVELEDGTMVRAKSAESARTMIYQDLPRALEVLTDRLASRGFDVALPARLAEAAFLAAEGRPGGTMRDLLDTIEAGRRG